MTQSSTQTDRSDSGSSRSSSSSSSPSRRERISGTLASVEARVDRWRRRFWDRLGLQGDPRIVPFLGYGNDRRLILQGRVLRGSSPSLTDRDGPLENLHQMFRLYESDEVPRARLEIAVLDGAGTAVGGASSATVSTDEEGYFRAELEPPPGAERPFVRVAYRLIAPVKEEGTHRQPVEGRALLPPDDARLLVISDMDDTVVRTGATDLFQHTRTVLLNNARSREPFPGVPAFYRGLHEGPGSGGEARSEAALDAGVNPIFFVSSSPWNLYELFEDFLAYHDLPAGPFLLKDFGLERGKIFKSGHDEHKVELIETLMELYDLPVLVIGDSGQRDPYIFREVGRRHPDRLAAIYIRDVTPGKAADELREIVTWAEEAGIPLVTGPTTEPLAEDAFERGWIDEDQLETVRREVAEARDQGEVETPGETSEEMAAGGKAAASS